MKKTFSIILICMFSIAYSQKDYSQIYNGDTIIKKGVELYEKGKYNESIVAYEKVNKLDSKYLTAQYEKAMALVAQEKKDEAKAIFENVYNNNQMKDLPIFYILYGNFLSDQKDYDAAEKIFNDCEKIMPNSSSLLFNKAILYLRKDDEQKSVDLFKKVILNNPNHASSHYFLGILALENGNITEGTLALLSYLAIAPNGKYAQKCIQKLNAKFGENYLEKKKLVFSTSGDNFEEIETILRNQLPLNKAYKVKSQLDDIIIRQIQAVAEYTLEHKMGNGFFETTYIPWIKAMVEQNQFEGFSYYMLSSLQDKIGKQLDAQKKKTKEFNDKFIDKDFWKFFAKRNLDLFGTPQDVIIYLKNNIPNVIGNETNGIRQGKFKLLNENENIRGELYFVDNELEGLQKYFDLKGNLVEQKYFKKGKLEGKRTVFYSNGMIDLEENYKENKLNGISTLYYINGGEKYKGNFTDGERDGVFISLYSNGNKKLECNYKKGKLDGVYTLFNELGEVKSKYNYSDGLLNGAYMTYYDGKTKKSEGLYAQDKVQGDFKKFYSNGALENQKFYENGKISKEIDYYADGKISTVYFYNSKEQLESLEAYNTKGDKYYEEKYKDGQLKSGVQYTLLSAKPIEINLSKKPFIVTSYEGKTIINGAFEKGKKEGEWSHYFLSGILKDKEIYKNGKRFGTSYSYEKNGTLNYITHYVNDSISGVYESYDNGDLKRVSHYYKGEQNGPVTTFASDGTIRTEGFMEGDEYVNKKYSYWQNGKPMYIEDFFENTVTKLESFDPNGTLENTIDYKNRTGKFSTKYYNGTTIVENELINGELNGKYVVKDKFNNLILETEFVNSARHNLYRSYSPYGTLRMEQNFYLGMRNGVEKDYDLIGNLRLTEDYFFNGEHGKTTRFFYNKAKFYEYNQFDSIIEGEYKYYNLKGEPILILGYSNNALLYYIKPNQQGQLIDKIPIINETVSIISNYASGKEAMKINFEKGNKTGEFVVYNSEGKPEIKSFYKNDLLDGERTEYYITGAVYKIEHFINGDFNGSQEYFNEAGKPIIKAEYKNDELHGDTKIYKDGILSVTKKYNSNELVEIIK